MFLTDKLDILLRIDVIQVLNPRARKDFMTSNEVAADMISRYGHHPRPLTTHGWMDGMIRSDRLGKPNKRPACVHSVSQAEKKSSVTRQKRNVRVYKEKKNRGEKIRAKRARVWPHHATVMFF